MKVTVYRKAHFNAAHRLYHPEYSAAKNELVFGKCSNPKYHGHNYELEVGVTGEIDSETGFVMDLKLLKELIEQEVEEPFDHKNLNEEVPEFKTLNPTAENICTVIFKKLKAKISSKHSLSVKLFETPRNFVTCEG